MKIAIHESSSWSRRWIEYCKENNIDYDVVNCYSSDIIKILSKYDVLFWHFHHSDSTDILMARYVLFTAEKMGIKVFPNFDTSWHFDDKVAQKYLLEGIDAPIVNSWAFYNKEEALGWLRNEATLPLVAKLRRGAGSYNVKLIKDYSEAAKYTNKMFGKGIHPTPEYFADIKNKLRVAGGINGILKRAKKLPRFFQMVKAGKKGFQVEKGYVFFQEFLPNNSFDTRISIVGDKAFGYRRFTRKGDFRASGSGMVDYEISKIDTRCVEIGFEVFKKLKAQSLAFDFVFDTNGNPKIVEISYGFVSELVMKCKGYWNESLEFFEGSFRPDDLIFEELLKEKGIKLINKE